MAASEGVDRGITESITFANAQLKKARQDGGCDQILFWAQRVDQLLDEFATTQGSAT